MIAQVAAFVMIAGTTIEVESALVPDARQHEWIEVGNALGVPTFLDIAYRGAGDIDGKTYPVVLVRYLRGEPAEKAPIVDFRVAINCTANAMSGIEINRTTAAHDGTGMRLSQKETLSTPFTPVYRQNEALVAPLFKHACGPEWSMKDTE